MTKRNLLLVGLLLVFGLGVMAPSALAQTTLTATTSVYTLRPNSNAEAVGPIYLNYVSGSGNITAGQSFNVIYSQPIVEASGVGGTNGPIADFCVSTATVTCSALVVTASGNTLSLTSPSAVTGGLASGYIEMYGVRINTYGLASGTSITATVYTSISTTNPFTFSNGTNSIGTIVGTVASTTALSVSVASWEPFSLLTCDTYPSSDDEYFQLTATENWAGAWTSDADEVALAPYLATNGSKVEVTVTGIPAGVTMTPLAPVNGGEGTQTWTTPAAYTGGVFNDSTTFVYTITATNRSIPVHPESATFKFDITTSAPLAQGNPNTAISVTLGPAPSASSPVYPAFSYPVFGLAEESPGTPTAVVQWQDCTTTLVYPYVTNYNGGASGGTMGNWDTALEVANMTSQPYPSTSNLYVIPQNGACTFSFYNAGTSTTIGTATQASPISFTTPVVKSGGNYAFMLSSTPAAGLTGGYAYAICNFLWGGGYAELVNNANGLGNWGVMAGYLAMPSGFYIPNEFSN